MPDGSAEHDGRDITGGCVLLEVQWDSCTVRTTTKESSNCLISLRTRTNYLSLRPQVIRMAPSIAFKNRE